VSQYSQRGLHGHVVNDMGLRIVSGQLPGASTIDPVDIGLRYDVSRTVVREAIKVLSSKGLVDARPKIGTYVRERENWNLLDPDVLRWQFAVDDNPEILEKLHEVRVMVEPAAAALAAARRTSDDLAELDAALADMETSDASTDAIVAADQRFHRGLIDATHNELVIQLAFVIETGLAARDQYVHNHRVSIRDALQGHRDVLESVRRRQEEPAREAMVRLLEAAALDVRRVRRAQGEGGTP
jgi:DNA-binding FadR family transcriptional regulator